MKNIELSFSTLLADFNRLETSLLKCRHEAPGIWPLSELDDGEFNHFINSLYGLTHECLAMHLRCDVPEQIPYLYDFTAEDDDAGREELIRLTRQLIFCCDVELINEYRPLARDEYFTIRLLEMTHAQLIGAHYYQHPGEESIGPDEIRFIS
jgi:hypothetical protein